MLRTCNPFIFGAGRFGTTCRTVDAGVEAAAGVVAGALGMFNL